VASIYEAGADYVFMSRIDTAVALGEAIGRALNGTLGEYRAGHEAIHGRAGTRTEVLS
jgi:hypothetical protein